MCGNQLIEDPEEPQKIWRFMGIFSENRPEWLLMQLACMKEGITVVPIPVRAADGGTINTLIQ